MGFDGGIRKMVSEKQKEDSFPVTEWDPANYMPVFEVDEEIVEISEGSGISSHSSDLSTIESD